MSNSIELTVRQFIEENFLYQSGLDSFSDDTSFLGAHLIDSTGILELVHFLEQTFGIRIADEDMLPENLDSVSRIGAYVRRKQGSGEALATAGAAGGAGDAR